MPSPPGSQEATRFPVGQPVRLSDALVRDARFAGERVETVDTPAGRRRVRAALQGGPWPRSEPTAGHSGPLVRIEKDGTRTLCPRACEAAGRIRREFVALAPGQWKQLDGVLGTTTNGYVHMTVVSGFDAFFAYATVVDGKDRNSGTNDGSYVPMVVSQ